jgi:hypothetical protein
MAAQRSVPTAAEQEAAFQLHLDSTATYFAAVREAGDLPWFAEGSPRRTEALAQLGLPEETSGLDLRRAMFLRRHRR